MDHDCMEELYYFISLQDRHRVQTVAFMCAIESLIEAIFLICESFIAVHSDFGYACVLKP
jgi:hypothetical protein